VKVLLVRERKRISYYRFGGFEYILYMLTYVEKFEIYTCMILCINWR
jgi:hypothetical protein